MAGTGLSCGMVCLKYILFAFNFVFWLAGIGVLGVGIWSRIQAKDYDSFFGDGGVVTAANIMIAAGCFVMVIGFVGCCGALKESKWLLVIYFVLLLFIFILEIAAGIFAYVKKDKVIKEIKKNVNKAVQKSYGGSTPADKSFTTAVDKAQKKLQCCGTNGADDWKTSVWYTTKSDKINVVPSSCCMGSTTNCTSSANYKKAAYSKGCVKALEDYVKSHIAIIGGIGVGIAFIQLLGMVFAMCLCRSVGYEQV